MSGYLSPLTEKTRGAIGAEKMHKLSTKAKEAIIEKVLKKDGRTLTEIAKVHNIGVSTLGKWVRNYRKNGTLGEEKNPKANSGVGISVSERFEHIMATASLDEAEIGIYCREKGIYSFQLIEWKEAFMKQSQHETAPSPNLTELKTLRMENKALRQDLRRKESALAEVTALLILKKKASLIWGETGDD